MPTWPNCRGGAELPVARRPAPAACPKNSDLSGVNLGLWVLLLEPLLGRALGLFPLQSLHCFKQRSPGVSYRWCQRRAGEVAMYVWSRLFGNTAPGSCTWSSLHLEGHIQNFNAGRLLSVNTIFALM